MSRRRRAGGTYAPTHATPRVRGAPGERADAGMGNCAGRQLRVYEVKAREANLAGFLTNNAGSSLPRRSGEAAQAGPTLPHTRRRACETRQTREPMQAWEAVRT